MSDASETERRKEEHLRIPLERDVQSIPNPWDAIRLRHEPLPGFDKDDIELNVTFLGKPLEAPMQITGMTGGARQAKQINARLAATAAEHGIAMGVGSQRAALENPELADTYSVILEHEVPLRLANLGLPQLLLWDDPMAKAEQAIEMIDAHALCIHLNTLQEAVQPEGDTEGAGGIEAITDLCKQSKIPILLKETGAGIDGRTAKQLETAGVKAIDVGGLGGTSFSAVEYHRAVDQGDEQKARLGKTFWDWGIPTPYCVRHVRTLCPGMPIVATGGLRNGLDAARALALGADIAGFAGQMFRAAADDRASQEMSWLLEELKTSLFLAGVRHPPALSEDHCL